jgi:hypothetical protein
VIRSILLFFTIAFLISCQQERNSIDQTQPTSDYQNTNIQLSNNSFFNFFKEIDIVSLHTNSDFCLSFRPYLRAINKHGDFIILDNLNVRQILVFDKYGQSKAKIGAVGKEDGNYLFPENILYQPYKRKYYVYDEDLLRISEYNEDFTFSYSFPVPLFLDAMIVSDDNRIFGYSSTVASRKGGNKLIYEIDQSGKILNSFFRQSRNFTRAAASKGGGILLINNYLYIITPYEYTLSKYNLNGKLIKVAQGKSHHYIPPTKPKNIDILRNDLRSLQEFHDSWSHIRQIIQLGDNLIGVVIAEAGEARTFLDLFDTNLNWIVGDILLPKYVGEIYSKQDHLYLLSTTEPDADGELSDLSIIVYSVKYPGNIIP